MPFESEAQRRFMFARHPKIAKRWADTYGITDDLPKRKGKKRSKAHPAAEGLKRATPR